jgi:hypothetical protein
MWENGDGKFETRDIGRESISEVKWITRKKRRGALIPIKK